MRHDCQRGSRADRAREKRGQLLGFVARTLTGWRRPDVGPQVFLNPLGVSCRASSDFSPERADQIDRRSLSG